MRVTWSSKLENLAEGMFSEWEKSCSGDPFARTCIVVGDVGTRNWLQHWFLLKRKGGARKILANVDFIPVPQFINDWIAAATGTPVKDRKSSAHPYAQNVLAWRIYALLQGLDKSHESVAPLFSYIGDVVDLQPKRRYALAVRLARLYDDYLASRPEILQKWEHGETVEGADAWQGELYKKLTEANPDSYAALYERFAGLSADACTVAFDNGFPRYQAVHVFDVAFAPKIYLEFIRKLSALVPMSFWNFTPSNGYWMDVEKKRKQPLNTPADERLLGALATGGRAVLDWEIDAVEGDVAVDGCPSNGVVSLPELETIELHSTYAPRRELEAVRNGLLDFFVQHPDAKPSDALVLCADWNTYAPLIRTIFGTHGSSEGVPIKMESGVAEASVLKNAFEILLGFRDNRFEASKVFALLETPAIARKFELEEETISFFREIVKKANIRNGYDESTPWCWRRGLDRLLVDALMGKREEESLVQVGKLPEMLPCGPIEGERARNVAKLASFVEGLAKLRAQLRTPHCPKAWSEILTPLVDLYFKPSDEDEGKELQAIRKAILQVETDATLGDGGEEEVTGEVYLAAVLQGVKDSFARVSATGDAVRFVPLSSGTATTAEFVWICGLSEGAFPRGGKREAFDLAGRSPSLFDVTSREKDTYALLKAVLGARGKLAFSYVGKSIRTNEKIPAAVPLLDVLDWLRKSGIKLETHSHPLQSYSAEYFKEGRTLPPNYAQRDYAAAVALRGREGLAEDAPEKGVSAFEFAPDGEVTVLELSDILEFLDKPNRFVTERRLRARQYSDFGVEVDDEGPLDVKLSKGKERSLLFDPPSVDELKKLADASVERGDSLDSKLALEAYLAASQGENALDRRQLLFKKEGRGGANIESPINGDVVRAALNAQRTSEEVKLLVKTECLGRQVEIHGSMAAYQKDKAWYHLETGFKADVGFVVEGLVWRLSQDVDFVNVAVNADSTTKLRALAPIGKEDAQGKLNHLLALCFEKLPEGMPDAAVAFDQDGKSLEEQVKPLLEGVEWWVSRNLPKQKKAVKE